MNIRLFQTRLDAQHLEQDQETINRFMEKVYVRKTATQFIPADPDYWSIMVFYENEKPKRTTSKEPEKLSVNPDEPLTAHEIEIISALKQWRKDKAQNANVPDFLICQNAELLSLTKLKPRTMEELGRVKGFGEKKIARFGEDIIAVLNAF
jgi:superfamily II DNA helicase RecQ